MFFDFDFVVFVDEFDVYVIGFGYGDGLFVGEEVVVVYVVGVGV